MKLKSIFIVIAIFAFGISVQAQKQYPKFDVEKHHKEQAEFYTKELNLTDTEQKEFIPLLQEYMHARFELNRDLRTAVRNLKAMNNKTSADYQKVIDMGLDTKIKEAELQKEYFKKFGKVLPANKVLKYSRAEKKFVQQTLKRYPRDRD